jgi:hypothetical protein
MVSSGSPWVPGSLSGVTAGRPGAVRVPGGGPSVGSRQRTLRSARPVKSAPARPTAAGGWPGRPARGNTERRKALRPGCAAGPAGGPALPEGKAGRAGCGVVPGGDLVRARAVAGGSGSRPGCRPAGRAGLPPGTAGIQPPLRPPRQVAQDGGGPGAVRSHGPVRAGTRFARRGRPLGRKSARRVLRGHGGAL